MRSCRWLLAGVTLVACADLPDALQRAPGSASAVASIQSVLIGSPALLPPTVLVRDHQGIPMGGVTVHFSIVAGGGSIGASTAITDDSGIASAGSWTIGEAGGPSVVVATVEGITGPVQFAATVIALKQITGGSSHTCAVTAGSTGQLFCWGNSSAGQTGLPDAVGTNVNVGRQAYPLGISIAAAGFNHTCGLNAGDAAPCWGRNTFGQLGDGSTTTRPYVSGIVGTYHFVSLAVGADHACGLVASGDAYCWGLNANGQLGDGGITTRLAPVAVSGGVKFQRIAAGGNHTCAVATNTSVTYCWGENLHGGLGDGTTVDRHAPTPAAGGQALQSLALGNLHSCGVTSGGAAYCWGANALGQLGDGTTNERLTPTPVAGALAFTGIASRGAHTCALLADGLAYCWGENVNGQLGDGTTTNRTSPVAVSDGRQFVQIAAGSSHTCGVTSIGQAFCWGANANGQLGDGSFIERLTPVLIRVK